MPTAKKVMDIARSQIGYKESPANSNKTKYGKAFGTNGVPWCFIFEWWCGNKADSRNNPFTHNSNAGYGQDEIVSKKGGKWIMKKNKSKAMRKAALKMYREGDCVDFDFGKMDAYRRHTGLVDHVEGDYVYVIEGNTSPDGKNGSQSNGGMVCRKKRHYSTICSAARPAYSDAAPVEEPKPEPVTKPLTVDGILGYQTACRMQNWLGTTVDGEIGPNTIRALQKKIGAKPVDGKWGKHTSAVFQRYLNANGAKLADDGVFGKNSVRALQTFLNKYYAKPDPKPTPKPEPKPAPKTNGDKLADKAKALAWPEGTPKSKCGYPDGSATVNFKAAINRAYPDRSKWGKQTRAGASCDVFVGTCVRDAGIDPKFPRGLDGVEKHCKDSKAWQTIKGIKNESQLKPGDVVFYKYPGGGHIFIYLGNGKIANAHYNGKTYGIVQNIKTTRKPSQCKVYNVYRAK